MNKERPGDRDIQLLVREIKRIRRAYIGEELICMSPIAERTGKRVKILVNHLNADAACIAAQQGVDELYKDVNKWNKVLVGELGIPLMFHEALRENGILTVGELLTMTDKDLQRIDLFDDYAVYRIGSAMKSIGIHE
jgi:DNA-directed RNA polymerase alpha subunit